jgi:hypothetical protein
VNDIMTWNKGVRPKHLAAGTVITVYTHRADD